MTIEEVEARRAKRRERHDADRDAQELVDMTAIDALEEQCGVVLHTMTSNSFKPGAPVKIAFRAPLAIEYKRYLDTVGIAQQKGDTKARRAAQETLALACLMYPQPDGRAVMLDAFPGTLISLSIEAAKVAELRAEDEKNG